jgi:DNA (cytosine-5)-methyltransferase 1
MIRVVDFFSGCGGTSLGFSQAGMRVVLGIDSDADAAATFQVNIKGARFLEDDICTVSAGELAPFLDASGPFLFSCCAPCQPFSKQNRLSRPHDPRRSLLGEFGRFVRRWRPEYIFVENVPGLQHVGNSEGPLSEFLTLLTKLRYSHVLAVLPALSYGVPQRRERLILLASKTPGLAIPPPTHGKKLRPVATVRDWIGDLPPLMAGESHPADSDHQASGLSMINLKRIAATPEGGGRDSWPKSLWLDCHKKFRGHSDVYGRLSWDRPAAGLTTRCISYSNGRFGHPIQDRAISVREAACLQTFPRHYKFMGSQESKARQIGNAVPPLMAKVIGEAIVSHERGLILARSNEGRARAMAGGVRFGRKPVLKDRQIAVRTR